MIRTGIWIFLQLDWDLDFLYNWTGILVFLQLDWDLDDTVELGFVFS